MPGNGPVRFGGRPGGKGPAQTGTSPPGRPYADPQKVARRPQAPQPATLAQLQAQLDAFTSYYNTHRPHKSLPGRATPAAAYTARPKATPGDRAADTHDRVRTDKIGTTGKVTLRHGGRLYHLGIGRAHAGTQILLLVQDLHIRVIAVNLRGGSGRPLIGGYL
jgi:hypothetical protein